MAHWIEAAEPIAPWKAAHYAPRPDSGIITTPGLTWHRAGDNWFVIASDTGGWVLLDDDERATLLRCSGGLAEDFPGPTLLTTLWRRAVVRIGGRGVFDGVDWGAAYTATKTHYGLIMILNSGCNLACTYCYLGHAAPSRTNDVEPELARAAIRSALARPELEVMIDFGEIAAATKLFYELADFAFAEAETAGKSLRIAVQTNATTLNDELIDFLASRPSVLGISLDGPREMHDLTRLTRSGRPTYDSVDDALSRCREAGLPFHLIVTVGAHNVHDPDGVLDEIIRQEPHTFLCKPILAHGEASNAWDRLGASENAIADFLQAPIKRAAETGLHHLDQSAAKFLSRLIGDARGWRESCTSRHCSSGRDLHVLSARGEMHGCPRFVEGGSGHAVTPQTVNLVISRKEEIVPDSLHTEPASCGGCPWLRSCGGGCTLSGGDDRIPLADPHCASYTAQHLAITEVLIPALVRGTIPFDGPLAGAQLHSRSVTFT